MNKNQHPGHPNLEQLRDFLAGKVAGTDALTLEDHLGQCEICQQTLAAQPYQNLLAELRPDPAGSWLEAWIAAQLPREYQEGKMEEVGLIPFDDFDQQKLQDTSPREALAPGTISQPSRVTVPGQAESRPFKPEGRTRTLLGLPVIPGYEILEVLGRGGMGVVYKARQIQLNRLVALKMILGGIPPGPEQQKRFRREAEAIAHLQHPHIVQIYEVGEFEGRPYLTLEFVSGGSLAHKLAGTPLPANDAARLVLILARAIHVAHQQGIVHRDLKPANILLTAEGQPKITDFGLAKQQDTEAEKSSPGAIVGSPSYMAPEQAQGWTWMIGPAADVYALGAILYELLTGRPPFKAASPMDTLLQVITEDPVPPGRLQPGLPRDLETICLKCLQKQASRRYPSAENLAGDLEHFLKGEPIQARPISPLARLARWYRRNPPAAITASLATAALFLAVITVMVLFSQLNQETRFHHLAEHAAQREKEARLLAEKKLTHLRQQQDRLEKENDRLAKELDRLKMPVHP